MFLHHARQGICLNLLTLRVPSNFLRTDACEHGIGGFSLSLGAAWRFAIPSQYWGTLSLNLLEFLASAITIMVELLTQSRSNQACLLSQLNSTTADYWLHRGGAMFHAPYGQLIFSLHGGWPPPPSLMALASTPFPIADALSPDHHLTNPN